jgi:hypothetical protein
MQPYRLIPKEHAAYKFRFDTRIIRMQLYGTGQLRNYTWFHNEDHTVDIYRSGNIKIIFI